MKIIAGLGNPGRDYARTPHNAGFLTVDALAKRLTCRLRSSWRFRATVGEAVVGAEKVLLVQPQTFMNNSGAAVASIVKYRKLTAADLVVIVDDADLQLGVLRLRPRGSSAGHKGLESVAAHLGTEDFGRVRIGIGRGPAGQDLVARVLTSFKEAEWQVMQEMIARAADAVLWIVEQGMDSAMNRFNARGSVSGRKPDEMAGGNE